MIMSNYLNDKSKLNISEYEDRSVVFIPNGYWYRQSSLKREPVVSGSTSIPPVKYWSIKKGDYHIDEMYKDTQILKKLKRYRGRLILILSIIISGAAAGLLSSLLSLY